MRLDAFPYEGKVQPKASPLQGRWLGEAETERVLQICDDLSSLRLPASLPLLSLWDISPLIGGIGP